MGFSAKERKNLETHMRFGHASREMLRMLQRSGDIRADEYFEEASMPSCYACDAGAMQRKPSPGTKAKEGYSRSWEPGELLVMDMIPLEATALGGTNSMLLSSNSHQNHPTTITSRPMASGASPPPAYWKERAHLLHEFATSYRSTVQSTVGAHSLGSLIQY